MGSEYSWFDYNIATNPNFSILFKIVSYKTKKNEKCVNLDQNVKNWGKIPYRPRINHIIWPIYFQKVFLGSKFKFDNFLQISDRNIFE